MFVSIKMINDGVNHTRFNSTFETKTELKKVLVYLSLSGARGNDDHDYQQEFLRTTFDLERVFGGVFSNVLAKTFMENLSTSASFQLPLKFPLQPVNELSGRAIKSLRFIPQASYQLTDFIITDKRFPPFIKRFRSNFRVVGKTSKDKMQFMLNCEGFVKITRPKRVA